MKNQKMKWLSLHLVVVLLVWCGFLCQSSFGEQSIATTIKPPSLLAPHRLQSTFVTTTPTSSDTTSSRSQASPTVKRRQLRRQPAASSELSLAHATQSITSHNNNEPSVAMVAGNNEFISPRLVRDAEVNSRPDFSANSVRQNRSFQTVQRNNNNDDVAATNGNYNNNNNNNNINNHKYKSIERRQHHRMTQSSTSNNGSDGGINVGNDDANSETSKNNNNNKFVGTSTSSPSASSAHEQMSMSTFMANHRKPQALRFRDGDQLQPESELEAADKKQRNATTTKLQQQTLKTPRMIHRLVAGHIQNAEGRSTYQVSSITSNGTITNSSTTSRPTPLYFRRKPTVQSSSYRHVKLSTTTKATPTIKKSYTTSSSDLENEPDRDDDEALLDDPNDFDNWDNGILRLSAGSGKENLVKSKKFKEDSKKTLADQVRDGKYGLIEQELFKREPKRPGILSYLPNKDVPIDNEHNFGGLNEEDIWLAEDHLLVIKGGMLNEENVNEPWSPIDDYVAPSRQIKIPPHPKVPPPFPVQLEENGPLQFIGNNKFTIVYPIANESIPIYTAGAQANDKPSSSDSDNEKNFLTRPGTPQSASEDEPGYIYPSPYPPWIFHNQTFVNPFLNNSRPIKFPGLGPFPFGRNGSLDNTNITDYFDEDDPTLYYPPAYSFVYKSNYSNPVPPGPLVPGIVLPPPANQFSRLEKSEKKATDTVQPFRQRLYPTTTSTPSTPTSTTTTELPHYQRVITKITEYTPKVITITPAPPSTTSLPHTRPPPIASVPFEPVPVPVAIPVPIFPEDNYPVSRPNIVTFVPTTPEPVIDTLSKSNPIYYEYFEAKKQPTTSNVIDEFLATTVDPPSAPKPIKIYSTSKRPFKNQSQRNYGQYSGPTRQLVPEKVVYITPKPEIRHKPKQDESIFKPRPIENFEHEVNAIRETLRYYQNQQLRDNSIPRAPKAKSTIVDTNKFQPPSEFDESEPFKPMVTYSPSVDDKNAFRAIAYDVDNELPTSPSPSTKEQSKYQSSTTLVPVQPDAPIFRSVPRTKKLRLGAKYLQQPLVTVYQPHQQQLDYNYQSTPRASLTTESPWEFIDKKEYPPQQQQQQQRFSERLQLGHPVSVKNRGFNGYYYAAPPPPQPIRQNNRFYEGPFQNSMRKAINYRPPLTSPQHQQQSQQQQQPSPYVWSLENDTYVNYAPNRPPLNPDAEFINPYQSYPHQQQYSPPPLSHQSQYYGPVQRYPPISQSQSLPSHRHQQAYPLHRDILVNYRQPLPPINPQSEYISHPHQVLRYQHSNPVAAYRSANGYRQLIQPTGVQNSLTSSVNGGAEQQANVFYITPKYRRANNINNNNNNNDNNNNNANGNTVNDNNGK